MSTVYLVPDDVSRFAPIGFDATMNEAHSLVSHATQNPVEDGSVISDHVLHEPPEFSCSVMTSQQPIATTFFGDGSTRPRQLNDGSNVIAFGVDRPADLIREMLDRLDALRLAAASMTILTSHREYDGMRLLRIDLPKEEGGKGAGKFTLSFSQLQIVKTSIVAAPQPKEPRGQGKLNKGTTNPKPADDTASKFYDKDKSLGANLYDNARKLLSGGF